MRLTKREEQIWSLLELGGIIGLVFASCCVFGEGDNAFEIYEQLIAIDKYPEYTDEFI